MGSSNMKKSEGLADILFRWSLQDVFNENLFKLSSEAGFARSLFERLSSLGHPKHLLNTQYRMHPSISHFPNAKFYLNNIFDAPNVMSKSYTKQYLPGPMFGPYSFINVVGGKEEKDPVEVAIILKLLNSLYKAWNSSKVNISIGVISPCAAQVTAIQEKLDRKFEICGFSVKVGSIDGFQGREEDIIIISTARANRGGAIGFMSNYRRINVALTRARHCLWILGNERILVDSESIWTNIVNDARERSLFFNVDLDQELAKSILEVKKEFDQLDDLLNGESVLFRDCRWKVLFSENFRRSFGKLASVQTKTTALNYILRLSSGWRPKKRNADVISESFQFLRQFKIAGVYVICSVDIVKEKRYTQVLKVWDILPIYDVQKLIRSLNGIFERYTDDFISRCNEKCLEGDSEIPITWSCSTDIIRYKSLGDDEPGSNLNSDDKCYVENSKVSDSLLLMKFYNLSSGVVSHLLSGGDGRELELPFELTDKEMEIIFYQRSTFILGRSGTGKTTVLTMKLFKKEQLYLLANEGHNGDCGASFKNDLSKINARDDKGEMVEPVEDGENGVLRQLFVTVSPKLCFAVKQQVAQLKSFVSGGKYSACNSSVDREDVENAAGFEDIPDSFAGVPPKAYPLVITFNKFIMMLDGTIGTSYFERFPDMRHILSDKMGNFSGSIVVQSFLKTREVNFEKFCSMYWPHFNSRLTTKLDFSRIFIEIMSRIKGVLQARESSDGRLTKEDYVVLAESRTSTLNRHEREMIYDAYEDYEKMKMENGDFDMADIVIDLHRRLRDEIYGGDMMDFVYIDEVQDLTMSQVALFKHISKNVKEGFVFSGDTAQTIARGIDFRFEDIKSLFYDHFLLGSRTEGNDRMKEKGHISKIFQLSQNFRTHAGVLKLAQGVIDLLYHFFPTFVDILSQETSLVFGEAPILLESGNDENAIVTIFGNHGDLGSKFIGFGAEQAHKSTRGQVLSARKILDAHLKFNNSKFGWEDHMIHDLAKFSEGEISKNQVSAETLVHYWDFWKNSIVNIFEYLRSPDVSDVENCGDFCLNYMGVRRQFNGLNPIYNLMIPDANWANELDSRSVRSNGKFISLDVHQFASAAQSYWSSELLSVGMDVLGKLESLYSVSVKNSSSLFCQSRHLCHIYTVAKFLLDSKFLDRQYNDNKALKKFVKLPTQHLFSCVFLRDLKESLKENMISLRRTGHIGNLVKEVTCEAVGFKNRISYEQLGRILVAIFGSSKLDSQLFEKIKDGLRWNPSWMALIVEICKDKDNKIVAPDEQTIMWTLHGVLQDTYKVNSRKAKDYFSPECFLYLVEHQLNLVSCIQGNFYTTKSSFCEMLIHMEQDGSSISWIKESDTLHVDASLELLVHVVQHSLQSCNDDTREWTNANAAVTLRLAATACLLYLNFGYYREYLFDWLGRKNINNQLPREFVDALDIRRKRQSWIADSDSDRPCKAFDYDLQLTISGDVHMLSETFKKMGNPLVLMSLGGGHGGKWCSPCTIFLDMINQSKEDMWTALFPDSNKATRDHKRPVELDAANSCNSLASLDLHVDRFPSNYGQLREMLNSFQSLKIAGDMDSFVASIPDFKASVEDSICIFSAALCGCHDSDTKNGKPCQEASMMLDKLKQLYSTLDMRELELVINIPKIGALLTDIQSKLPRIDDSQLDDVFLEQDEILKVVLGTCHCHEQEGTSEATRSGSFSQANLGNQADSYQAGNNAKGTGKMKKKPKGKRKGKR
ncbi:P-loop containing nucleoside triphosphate hydrolases superfamily protein [Euphorbia peplus]|nr:P-loop containing nucleoside triphosphate hydrolases superfamily protein [Euphorbia peplus]